MTPRDFIKAVIVKVTDQADMLAKDNGACRDRTIDQYRYQAGVVAGLRMSALMIDEEYKRLLQDAD